jgi:hypothetical protein
MKLSEIKTILNTANSVNFFLEDGKEVPEHFHVTEIGVITKNFIDCGGKVRNEKKANLQLLDANDYEHRLKPGKLLKIIALSEKVLGIEDLDIEVEYQTETIGKYGLDFNGKVFVLTNKQTACLAKEQCGIIGNKELVKAETSCCTPGCGCC